MLEDSPARDTRFIVGFMHGSFAFQKFKPGKFIPPVN
jgi:hypothetical protein